MGELINFSSSVFILPSMTSWYAFIWWYILVFWLLVTKEVSFGSEYSFSWFEYCFGKMQAKIIIFEFLGICLPLLIFIALVSSWLCLGILYPLEDMHLDYSYF